MYVDAQLLFSDAQAVTAAAGSDNQVDLGAVRDIGTGEDLYLVGVVDVAMTDGAGNTYPLVVALEGDSTTSFTPDGTQDMFTFPAASAIGVTKIAKLSPGALPLQYRYIRLKFTPTGGNLTAGSFTTFITSDVQKYTAYADNITIS
jgi:hypothetical protein